jgi:hemolysin activation/secretion protein
MLRAHWRPIAHQPHTVGDYASFSIPYGWWTFGVTGSESRYQEEIPGSITAFESLGTQKGVAAWVKRSIHRDATSHTDIQLQLQRRWNRSYIDGTEIGLQHQDLTDMQAAILDSRNFGQAEFDSELAYRQGLPTILGAQEDEPGRTSDLPTSRYKIAVLDVAGMVPLEGPVLGSYHIEARAQYGFNQPYGPDLFAVGGPYSVRGFDPGSAILGKTGWYVRQELASVPLAGLVQPFILMDTGQVNSSRLVAGFGPGLKVSWRDFQLMAYAADALSRPPDNKTRCCQLGFNFSYNFSAL